MFNRIMLPATISLKYCGCQQNDRSNLLVFGCSVSLELKTRVELRRDALNGRPRTTSRWWFQSTREAPRSSCDAAACRPLVLSRRVRNIEFRRPAPAQPAGDRRSVQSRPRPFVRDLTRCEHYERKKEHKKCVPSKQQHATDRQAEVAC